MESKRAFTIVELLVVIIAVTILILLVVVGYSSLSQKAITASLQVDATNAKKSIMAYQALNDSYPTSISCPAINTTDLCIQFSSGNSYTYNVSSDKKLSFSLIVTSGSTSYQVTERASAYQMLGIVTNGLILLLDAANPASYPGTGSTWYDLSGKGANGTLSGTVSYVAAGDQSYMNFAVAGDNNVIGSSLDQNYLDGSFVIYPDLSRNGNASLAGLIATAAAANDRSMRFVGVNGVGPWTMSGNNPGNYADWAYPSATTYYVNGAVSNTLVTGWNVFGGYRTNQSNFPYNFKYTLGSSGYSGRGYQGRIAFVALYNRQLSASEQSQNYTALRGRYGI